MFLRFFKPKWQHPKAEVRKVAVAELNDTELLFRIAREDNNLDVCEVAIAQLSHLPSLFQLQAKNGLGMVVGKRITHLLSEHPELQVYSSELAGFIANLDHQDMLIRLVSHTNDARICEAALDKISDPQVLTKLCVEATSSDARFAVACRLNDEASIRSARKILGKRDKRVARQLRKNLNQVLEQQAKAAEIDSLLRSVDELGQHERWQRDQARYHTLQTRWQALESIASELQQQYWMRASGKLEQRLAERKAEAEAMQPLIESKQSLSEQVETFSAELNSQTYLRQPEFDEINATITAFASEWAALPPLPSQIEDPLDKGFSQQLERCNEQARTLANNARDSVRFDRLLEKGQGMLQQTRVNTSAVEKLATDWLKRKLPNNKAFAENLQNDYHRLMSSLRARLEKQAETRTAGLNSINHWLLELERELKQDRVALASKLYGKIEKTLDGLVEVSHRQQQDIEDKLGELRPRLRELDGWRHWGTDRAKEQLIAEAESLAETKLSVKDRAKTIISLRDRWKQLGKIDPKSSRKLWQRFDKVCTAAYAPVQAQHEADNKQRLENQSQREKICVELEEIARKTDWSHPDWCAINKQHNHIRSRWREAGAVSRGSWSKINERFKSGMVELDSHLEDERRICYNRRLTLIEKIEALKDHEDLAAALQIAREAQKSWQITVPGRRAEEQKLWQRFRGAVDSVFAREQARRDASDEKLTTLLGEKAQICDVLEQLADLEGEALRQAHGEFVRLQDRWETSGESRSKRYEKLERRYDNACRKFEQATEQQTLNDKLAHFESLLNGDCNAANPANAVGTEALQSLLLELEILFELDSPEAQANTRMRLQVERLADAMASSHSHDKLEKAMQLVEKLCQQKAGGITLSDLEPRIYNIRAAILRQFGNVNT